MLNILLTKHIACVLMFITIMFCAVLLRRITKRGKKTVEISTDVEFSFLLVKASNYREIIDHFACPKKKKFRSKLQKNVSLC